MSGMSYQEIMKYTSNLSEHMYQCEKCGRKEIIRAGETKKSMYSLWQLYFQNEER